jgi:hypothetical protein
VSQPITGFGVRFATELLGDAAFLAGLARPRTPARA